MTLQERCQPLRCKFLGDEGWRVEEEEGEWAAIYHRLNNLKEKVSDNFYIH